MFCEECGWVISEGQEYCPECGTKVTRRIQYDLDIDNSESKDQYSTSRKPNASTIRRIGEAAPERPRYTGGVQRHNNTSFSNSMGGYTLADGEVIVQQYQCARTNFAAGTLTVTNKRIIYYAKSSNGSSRVSNEVTISSVSGVSCYYGTNYNMRQIILGFVAALLGVAILSAGSGMYLGGSFISIAGFILLLIGIVLIALGFRQAFQLAIFAKDVNVSPIVIGEGPTSILGNSAIFAVNSMRTKDTDRMLNELGAIVQDLQTMGDLAIEKWQKRISLEELPQI